LSLPNPRDPLLHPPDPLLFPCLFAALLIMSHFQDWMARPSSSENPHWLFPLLLSGSRSYSFYLLPLPSFRILILPAFTCWPTFFFLLRLIGWLSQPLNAEFFRIYFPHHVPPLQPFKRAPLLFDHCLIIFVFSSRFVIPLELSSLIVAYPLVQFTSRPDPLLPFSRWIEA